MRRFLDRFILGFPILFLKQYPYAWLAMVILWTRAPSVARVCLAIVVIGMLAVRWQSAAWISHMKREYAPKDGKFYVDQPGVPWRSAARKIVLLIAGSGLIAFLLRDQFGLSFWQILLMAVGYTLLYRDTQFFGAGVTYIITATGIAIRFVPGAIDYRVLLNFKEISRIEPTQFQTDKGWDSFARTRDTQEGLLMIPKDPNGFTKLIDKLFIVPRDREKFMEQLPYGYR